MNAIDVVAPAGTVRGAMVDGVATFRGIPYAEPPVGPLRFAPPVRAARSSDIIDATRFGAISIQDIDPLPLVLPGTENNYYQPGAVISEDCLSLNIWSPDLGASAPVLVWVHGGAFMCGSGSAPWLDGSHLATRHGLVVVTLNYRLGYLGGLYVADHEASSSNLGLRDQLAALEWVHDNIAAFGGDPGLVTIGGQSAGALSVAALMTASASRGLFGRAIVESGHLGSLIDVESARATTAAILAELAIDPSADVLGQLRAVSTLRIAHAQRSLGLRHRAFPLVMDGDLIPTDALGALAQRTDVDLLIGTTAEEDRLFVATGWAPPESDLDAVLSRFIADSMARATAAEVYATAASASVSDAARQIATDHGWAEPARRMAEAHAAAGGRTFHYEFDWRSTALDGRLGATHLVDLPFFFGNLDALGVDDLLGAAAHDDAAHALADAVSGYLAGFVRSGSPSVTTDVWPPYTLDARTTMVLATPPHLDRDRRGERLGFWADHRDHTAAPLSTLGTA
jgi:para-nitrobenzyl esterase